MQYQHYIADLILRKYNKNLYLYSSKEKKLEKNRNSKKIFGENDAHCKELEDKYGCIESLIGSILIHKILKPKINLTKKDILIIKKYLIISQIRVDFSLSQEDLDESLSASRYKLNIKKYNSNEEKLLDVVNCILNSNSLKDIIENKNAPALLVKWAVVYDSCYLAFWDSSLVNEDFIISDTGMTCEHEHSKFEFNEELSKRGILNLNAEKISLYDKKTAQKINLLANTTLRDVQANFYLFNISKDRTIALVNPFYKYHPTYKYRYCYDFIDIFPSTMSEEALKPNKYDLTPHSKLSDTDIYEFDIVNLSLEEVIYVNCLLLDRVHDKLAYVNDKKIERSISVYSSLEVKNVDYFNISSVSNTTNSKEDNFKILFESFDRSDSNIVSLYKEFYQTRNNNIEKELFYALNFEKLLIDSGNKRNMLKKTS